jgi:hypothetical protein
MGAIMPRSITHESFESIVGETVDLQAGEVSFKAAVEAVSLLRQNPGQAQQPFSVVLQSHDAINHGQQIYQLSHPGLEDQNLFLVPIGADERGVRYEIVFN